jgi:hypothetical protein
MGRFHWPHYAGQTLTVKATQEQSIDWLTAAREAGFPHTAKWIAEAADFYATFQKKQADQERKRKLREEKRVAERIRLVLEGIDPDTGEGG